MGEGEAEAEGEGDEEEYTIEVWDALDTLEQLQPIVTSGPRWKLEEFLQAVDVLQVRRGGQEAGRGRGRRRGRGADRRVSRRGRAEERGRGLGKEGGKMLRSTIRAIRQPYHV